MPKFDKNNEVKAIQNISIDPDILKGLHDMTLAEIPGTTTSTPGQENKESRISKK